MKELDKIWQMKGCRIIPIVFFRYSELLTFLATLAISYTRLNVILIVLYYRMAPWSCHVVRPIINKQEIIFFGYQIECYYLIATKKN